MKTYLSTPSQVLKDQDSTPEGLSAQEAARRLASVGPNKLDEGKQTPLLLRFLRQLADPMILILIAAAVISGITAVYAGDSFADVIIILVVVLINAVLGVAQESKAEKAIAALQEIAAATSKVLRDGRQVTLHSTELVPGDVILLEAGDAVPADARILESASMKVEEAALTGESVPVSKHTQALELGEEKDIPLGDRKNMVYMGSTVVYGRGRAVVTDTGMATEMGKIAGALTAAKEEQTPLQQKLSQLSKILSLLVAGLTMAAYFVGHYLEAGVWEITDSPDGTTMAFLTLSMVEIFHSFNMRSRRKSVFSLKKHNLWLWGAMVTSLVLTTAVIYVPFLSNAFGFEHISLTEYAVALGLAVSILPIMELVKLIQRKLGR